jgi:acyl-CoA synthetase (AMP-forming)/AMP-acid ligase II
MYETLAKLRFQPSKYPSLKTMTQAGGKLKEDLIRHFHGVCQTAGCRFFVMYGQTEATARISYVPPDRSLEKAGAAGVPIPGGSLSLAPVEGMPDAEELVYAGPNVMMGYADSRESLALGDELHGVLRTGDLGRQDADGFFYVTGRLKRFAKLFGSRVSLDDVEQAVEREHGVLAMASEVEGMLHIFTAPGARVPQPNLIRSGLGHLLGVPPAGIQVNLIAELPLTSSGKRNYKALTP